MYRYRSDESLPWDNEILKKKNVHNKTYQWLYFLLRCHYCRELPSGVAWSQRCSLLIIFVARRITNARSLESD